MNHLWVQEVPTGLQEIEESVKVKITMKVCLFAGVSGGGGGGAFLDEGIEGEITGPEGEYNGISVSGEISRLWLLWLQTP